MPSVILTIIQGLISTVPAALQAWSTLQPILAAGRDPTPEEWAVLMPQVIVAHAAVQGTAK